MSRFSMTFLDVVFCLSIVLVLSQMFPYFPKIHSANELSRVYLAESLAERGAVDIDESIHMHGQILDKAIREGKYYSDKAPGVAFIGALLYRMMQPNTLSEKVYLLRVGASIIPLFVILLSLAWWGRRHRLANHHRWLLVLSLGLGSHMTAYGVLAFGHVLAACCLLSVYLLLFETTGNRKWRLLMAGFFGAGAVVVEYPMAVYILLLGVMALLQKKLAIRDIIWLLLGGLVPLISLGVYHEAAFGSALKTGYAFIADKKFHAVHEQGFMGITYPKIEALGLSLLTPQKGLLFFFPIWTVAFLAIPRIIWHRSSLSVAAWIVIAHLLFVSSMVFPGGGWTVSQRHFVPMMPFLALLLGHVILNPSQQGWIPVAVCISILQSVLSLSWPHFSSSLYFPISELAWPLMRFGYRHQIPFWSAPDSFVLSIILLVIALFTLVVWVRNIDIRSRYRSLFIQSFILMTIYASILVMAPHTPQKTKCRIYREVHHAYLTETHFAKPKKSIRCSKGRS